MLRSMPICFTAIFLMLSSAPANLSVATGDAPRSVRITGPKELADLGKGQFAKWIGCRYSVQWGDGSVSPKGPIGSSCAVGFEHTYQKAGAYRIVAKIYHLGPNDSPVTDWMGEVQFEVK